MIKKDQPATKEDFTKLDAKVDATAQSLGAKLDANSADIARLDAKLDTTAQRLGAKLDANSADIARLDAKLDTTAQRLDAKVDRVAMEVVRTQADVRDIKATMSTKDDVERIMRAIDGFTAQAIHYQRADATRGKALIDVEVSMADHERRITGLESARLRPQTP